MTERIIGFLPSIFILACIAGLTFIYIKLLAKRWQENLKSIEWYKENQWKVEGSFRNTHSQHICTNPRRTGI